MDINIHVDEENIVSAIRKGLTNKQVQNKMVKDAIQKITEVLVQAASFDARNNCLDKLKDLDTPEIKEIYLKAKKKALEKYINSQEFKDDFKESAFQKLNDAFNDHVMDVKISVKKK